MPQAKPTLTFTITITPHDGGGYDVETDPCHPTIEETVEEVVKQRFTVCDDRPTRIVAYPNGEYGCLSDGPIAPARVRRGLIQLATVGAEDLKQANLIVIGYLYDAVVAALVGNMRERGLPQSAIPTLELDDGPIHQLRLANVCWWRDVRHVMVCLDETAHIRLRGIPRTETFSSWGNARILATFKRRLATALGIPISSWRDRRSRRAS